MGCCWEGPNLAIWRSSAKLIQIIEVSVIIEMVIGRRQVTHARQEVVYIGSLYIKHRYTENQT